ncbi:hypothetical protein AVEN_235104-1 [Araneus ventricosus]|uniref:Uncharacterized protein n=1 Tax=Araneus ventricosus TaxID=182803 RepID=A0A4Y2JAT1_ARAVE|nr:hypothetical protein AVEN_235104-1 [Araneus ventricosus]
MGLEVDKHDTDELVEELTELHCVSRQEVVKESVRGGEVVKESVREGEVVRRVSEVQGVREESCQEESEKRFGMEYLTASPLRRLFDDISAVDSLPDDCGSLAITNDDFFTADTIVYGCLLS